MARRGRSSVSMPRSIKKKSVGVKIKSPKKSVAIESPELHGKHKSNSKHVAVDSNSGLKESNKLIDIGKKSSISKEHKKNKLGPLLSKVSPRAPRTPSSPHKTPSKSPLKSSKRPAQIASLPNGDNFDIIEELRNRFQQLNVLRTTAAEALLQDYKISAEKRIAAANKLIEALKAENEILKLKVEECSTSHQNENIRRLSDISLQSGNNADTGNLLSLYEHLSGLRVNPLPGDHLSWQCTLQGKHGEFSFDLKYEEEEAQYLYSPNLGGDMKLLQRLPSYLQEEITFSTDQIQLFFWRALNFLMSSSK